MVRSLPVVLSAVVPDTDDACAFNENVPICDIRPVITVFFPNVVPPLLLMLILTWPPALKKYLAAAALAKVKDCSATCDWSYAGVAVDVRSVPPDVCAVVLGQPVATDAASVARSAIRLVLISIVSPSLTVDSDVALRVSPV